MPEELIAMISTLIDCDSSLEIIWNYCASEVNFLMFVKFPPAILRVRSVILSVLTMEDSKPVSYEIIVMSKTFIHSFVDSEAFGFTTH